MDKINVWFRDSKNVAWLIAGIAVVLIIVIVVLIVRSPKKVGDVTIDTPQETAVAAENKAPTYYHAQATVAPTAPKLSYDEAIRKYGEHRVQFGETCLATPATVVFKKGTEVMLDNRSAEPKVLTVNGIAYNVAAHDYAVAPLVVTPDSQDVLIDCGMMQNVATVTVQN